MPQEEVIPKEAVEEVIPKEEIPQDDPNQEENNLPEAEKKLRAENRKFRKEFNELSKKHTELLKLQDQGKLDKLAAEGKKDDLINELNKKLSEVEPLANTYKEYETNKREAIKKEFGKKWKDSYSKFSLLELEDFAGDMLKSSNGVDTDNKGVPANGKKVDLTDAQKREAATMGVTEEDWYEIQEQRKANLNNSQIKKV